MKNNLSKLKYELRTIIGDYPSLYLPLLQLKPDRYVYAVTPKTEIMIEGFPRSGNTFAVAAFQMAQSREVILAHHLHVTAQIVKAIQLKTPAILLIRTPMDAVVSLILRQPFISPTQGFRSYIRYYERAKIYKDHVIVSTFEEVTRDFGKIINSVNAKFNTNFNPFVHTLENLEECYKRIDQMDMEDTGKKKISERTVARPSSTRDNLKNKLLKEINMEEINPLITRAQNIYDEIIT